MRRSPFVCLEVGGEMMATPSFSHRLATVRTHPTHPPIPLLTAVVVKCLATEALKGKAAINIISGNSLFLKTSSIDLKTTVGWRKHILHTQL